ncbi:T9SS-dependent choice-of-anchor J family protein [Chishuiella changwenlii]|uniref:T9SS-dependent choice-of-anchor J family protein n=1 Tax=Chishuiella changwenlii TaxID=1434701 RepID=UPI002FDAB07F
MKKLLFIPLIALTTFSYAQDCTGVTEINEDFNSFTGGDLPQNCWSSDQPRPRAHVDLTRKSIQAYTFFNPNVPIYIITPEIQEFTGSQKLSFDAFVTGEGMSTQGTMQVGTLTDKNDITTFVPITEVYSLVAEGKQVKYENILIEASTTAKFIAFKFNSASPHTAMTLDNVTFGEGSLGTDDLKVVQKPTLYPNPAVDVLNIKSNAKVLSYEIYDLTGRKVGAGSNSDKVNVSNLSKGNYIINIVTKDGNTTTKFIKK